MVIAACNISISEKAGSFTEENLLARNWITLRQPTVQRIVQLETDMAEVKADVATLKTDMAEVKADVATLKTDVATLKTDVATLKTEVAEVKEVAYRIEELLKSK